MGVTVCNCVCGWVGGCHCVSLCVTVCVCVGWTVEEGRSNALSEWDIVQQHDEGECSHYTHTAQDQVTTSGNIYFNSKGK